MRRSTQASCAARRATSTCSRRRSSRIRPRPPLRHAGARSSSWPGRAGATRLPSRCSRPWSNATCAKRRRSPPREACGSWRRSASSAT
eukprot:13257707-Heterocapsa_arctica.AAC.1